MIMLRSNHFITSSLLAIITNRDTELINFLCFPSFFFTCQLFFYFNLCEQVSIPDHYIWFLIIAFGAYIGSFVDHGDLIMHEVDIYLHFPVKR